MRVRLHGFELLLGAVDLSDFWLHLRQVHGKEHEYRGDHRILYVADSADYYLGLLLSAKDQRKFCELTSARGQFKVTVRQLREKNRLVDFNFFAIHRRTGRGLYQHYRGSCGLSTFGYLLRKHYNDARDEKRNEALDAAGGDTAKKSKQREIREKFKETLVCTPMYKQDDFAELVKQLSQIRSFSFDFLALTKHEEVLTPATDLVDRERHTLTFSKEGPVRRIAQMVTRAAKDDRLDNVAVVGFDPTSGESVTYHLYKNLNSFHQCEFEEIADESILDLTHVENSAFFQTMLGIAHKNAEMFERRIRK